MHPGGPRAFRRDAGRNSARAFRLVVNRQRDEDAHADEASGGMVRPCAHPAPLLVIRRTCLSERSACIRERSRCDRCCAAAHSRRRSDRDRGACFHCVPRCVLQRKSAITGVPDADFVEIFGEAPGRLVPRACGVNARSVPRAAGRFVRADEAASTQVEMPVVARNVSDLKRSGSAGWARPPTAAPERRARTLHDRFHFEAAACKCDGATGPARQAHRCRMGRRVVPGRLRREPAALSERVRMTRDRANGMGIMLQI